MTNSVKFLSICSGIEAASVAWTPLGWEAAAFSEIEPFPSAVLAHHYPEVPNLGDMLTLPERILALEAPAPDLLCGGTPCQAFSVAGNRRSLDDARGNLSLTFCEIANAIDAVRARRGEPSCIVFWENVPGVLNTADNAFGCFLAGIAGEDVPLVAAGGKWTNAGCVYGPQRAVAWRVLDAQYFGVAQRRRRVFLVASARNGFDPAEILFEREGVRRDFAPSREARQEVAGTIAARFGDGGQPTGDVTVIGNVEGGAATTLSSREYKGLSCGRDGMTSAAVVYEAQPYSIMPMNSGKYYKARETEISQPLMAGGPVGGNQGGDFILQPIPIHDQATRFAGKRGENQDGKGNGLGIGEPGAPMNTLTKGDRHAVAYEAIPLDLRNAGRDPEKHDAVNRQGVEIGEAGDPSHTLTSAFVHGVAQPIGLDEEQNAMVDCFGTLKARTEGGGFEGTVMQTNMAVRRLTPVECERLQGFPDNYTNISWRGKPEAPDGPRYKALGNSWAVPNVRWIGARIDNYLKQFPGEQR